MYAVEAVEKGSCLEVQTGQPTIVESVKPWRPWMDIAEVQAGQRTRWIVYCSKTDAPAKMIIYRNKKLRRTKFDTCMHFF